MDNIIPMTLLICCIITVDDYEPKNFALRVRGKCGKVLRKSRPEGTT